MAGVVFTVEQTGIEKINERLGRLISLGEDAFKDLLAEIGEEVVSQTRTSFEEEKSPGGDAWEPSLRAMAERGLTLSDTARLKNSINFEVGASEVEAGTNVVYGAIHQFGGKAGRGLKATMPARSYIPRDDTEITDLPALIDDYILRQVSGIHS